MVKKGNFLYSIMRFLFPVPTTNDRVSTFLLVMRVLFGILILTHGIQKIANFSTLQSGFPDPMGVGSTISLSLVVFAEVACAIGFILGAFYRLALIPMIISMIVVFFVIHSDDPFAAKELPFVYLCVYILMFITGPGKFALDYFISEQISRTNDV